MRDTPETIAAIATAPGEGAIAIVRVSGPDSLRIADVVFRGADPPPSKRPGYTFAHGRVVEPGSEAGRERQLDEVILLIYRAPHSYTREDVVEFQMHGGALSARRVLRAVLGAGATPASPGEFTKRAFLNGRIDLLQAEAVLDLIRAKSDRSAAIAVEQLCGRLTSSYSDIYDLLISAACDLEATLDFVEEDTPDGIVEGALEELSLAQRLITKLLVTWDEGRILRDSAVVVIAGRPNVGKSTLLNALLGFERAIVSEIPGTTRDTIEETIVIDGFPIRIVDTAGLRESACPIEREGVARSHDTIRTSDLELYVVDASRQTTHEDLDHLEAADPAKVILIANKADLGIRMSHHEAERFTPIMCSATHGTGMDAVRSAILSKLIGRISSEPAAAISERHRSATVVARDAVHEAIHLVKCNPPDIAAACSSLRTAAETIGQITGRTYHDDLLSAIFSKFCVGK